MKELFLKSSQVKKKDFHYLPNLFRQKSFRFFSDKKTFPKKPLHSQIPSLPLLEKIFYQFDPQKNIFNMKNTAIIGVQHILPTTASLFNALIEHTGIHPGNMFFAGKFYSSCSFVENYVRQCGINLMPTQIPENPSEYQLKMKENLSQMWEKFCAHLKKNKHINKIIILDEGGYCLNLIPKFLPYKYEVAFIEQTRFGCYNKDFDGQLFPVIDVARCAAKKKLESPLIAAAVVSRLEEVIHTLKIGQDKIFGIVGNGVIGYALAKHLLAKDYEVLIYDENEQAFQTIDHPQCYRVDNLKSVIAGSDIVLGCTGKDISKETDILSAVKNSTTLISCSSQNVEFFTLLKQLTQDDFLVAVISKNLSHLVHILEKGKKIHILENGFPLNFDRTAKSDPINDMTLTRALLFCAVLQAFLLAKKPIGNGFTINKSVNYMLDPYLQQFVAKNWLVNQPINRYSLEQINCFDYIDWIRQNSTGEYQPNPAILRNFDLSATVSNKKT